MNKAKTRRAGVTVNKVVLKGVKAGRDINVNVGVAPEGQGRASEVIAVPSATTAEVDAAPPPPYAEGKDGEESGSNSRQVRERDVVPRLVDRHLTRKRPRHDKDSPTSSLAPEGNSSDPPNQHPQPKNLNPPTLTSIPDEPKPKRKRPRTNQIATTTREAIPENIPAISTLHAQEFATGPRLHSSSIRRIREPPPSNPRTRRPTLPTNPNHDTCKPPPLPRTWSPLLRVLVLHSVHFSGIPLYDPHAADASTRGSRPAPGRGSGAVST